MDRCPTCPAEFLPIPGSGPRQSQILWLGERPGARENERGEVFCGPTGVELDETYMRLAGIQRHEQRLENCVRCWAHNNRTPSDKEVDGCSRHFLPRVLAECKPDIVVLMGGRACRIADRRIRIDTHHGRPYYGSILNGEWEGMIWPSYHPALGMHDTSKMSQLLEDFGNLGAWLEGRWTPPCVETSVPDYRLCRTPIQLRESLRLDRPRNGWVAVDTETHGGREWSVQISDSAGTGRMVLAEDRLVLDDLGFWLNEMAEGIILHNAPQDLDTLAKMHIAPRQIRDTMQEAFHMGSLPQGLKPLAYQLLGVEMHSWEDTVWPASVTALQSWMEEAYGIAHESLAGVKETRQATVVCAACKCRQHVDKVCKKCGCDEGSIVESKVKRERTTGAVEAILKHVMAYMAKGEGDSESEYDPFKKLKQFWAEGLRGKKPSPAELDWLQEQCGPVPILGIGHCSQEQAILYACGDADYTLQVAQVLEQRRGDKRWQIAEGDEDQ